MASNLCLYLARESVGKVDYSEPRPSSRPRDVNSRGSFNTNGLASGQSSIKKVVRSDNRAVFEKFPTMLYPKTLEEHDHAEELKKELQSKHSLLTGIPRIEKQEKDKMIAKVINFDHTNTYE